MSSPEEGVEEGNEEGGGTIHHTGNVADPEYIIKFIQKVKSWPLLYNQAHDNFRNTGLKQQVWKLIANEFGQTGNICLV